MGGAAACGRGRSPILRVSGDQRGLGRSRRALRFRPYRVKATRQEIIGRRFLRSVASGVHSILTLRVLRDAPVEGGMSSNRAILPGSQSSFGSRITKVLDEFSMIVWAETRGRGGPLARGTPDRTLPEGTGTSTLRGDGLAGA